MIRQNICILLTLLFGGVGGALVSSCTDTWDDHYASEVHGDGTLWQAISKNSNLSNFKAVLEACGYEESLNGSQVFTVFAPTNDNFSDAQRDSVIALYKEQKAAGVKEKRNKAVKEFVQNHIALYNYSTSESTNDSIVMMNGKYLVLNGNKMAGNSLTTTNTLTSNGVLFTMDNIAAYKANVFELIDRDPELTGLRSFLYMGENATDPYKFYSEHFDASQSVPGEIVDGQTQYLDSVTVVENSLLDWTTNSVISSYDDLPLGLINNEDSTYWMIAPTNSVWDKLIEEYSQYYQYDAKTTNRDSLEYTMPRLAVVRGTVFSKTDNPSVALKDSAISTNCLSYRLRKAAYGSYDTKYYQYDKPYDAGGVFTDTRNVECSNGVVMKVDDWKIKKSETFLRPIITECESFTSLDSVNSKNTQPLSYVYVTSDNPFYDKVSNNGYAELNRTGASIQEALFKISDVLSNVKYDVYVVTAPALAGDTLASAAAQLPTVFRTNIYYNDLTGTQKNFGATSAFETDPTKVDSIFVGTYTFPACSYSASEPQVHFYIQSRASATNVKKGVYTSTIRLDCIIFRPHEDD